MTCVRGTVLWRTDGAWEGLAIGIVVNGNPMWHSVNLGMGVFESLVMEFERMIDPGEDFNVWAAVTLGAEGYVVGRMAQGAAKGYVALADTDVYGRGDFHTLLEIRNSFMDQRESSPLVQHASADR